MQNYRLQEEIDSLMWKQPDSALTVMLKFAASPEADSLDDFEEHYCQMLISELLYKNYYEQSNREELLKAVDYFDSIVAADGYKTDSRRDAPRASANEMRLPWYDSPTNHHVERSRKAITTNASICRQLQARFVLGLLHCAEFQ